MKPGSLKLCHQARPQGFSWKCERAWYHASRPSWRQSADGHEEPPAKRSRTLYKDFFMSVLATSATKRDAKGYLSRFLPLKLRKASTDATVRVSPEKSVDQSSPQSPYASGVNLGDLFAPVRAMEQTPFFSQHREPKRPTAAAPELHVAVVKIKDPQHLDQETLNGVALTLAQLARLGMVSAVVVDCGISATGEPASRALMLQQSTRLAAAIETVGETRAQVLDQTLAVCESKSTISSKLELLNSVHVNYSQMLLSALNNNVIAVIPPVAYNQLQQAMRVAANQVVVALTKEFAGLGQAVGHKVENTPSKVHGLQKLAQPQERVSLDRIIILDSAGGIPAPDRPEGSHIFINMEQEYRPLREQLSRASESSANVSSSPGKIDNAPTFPHVQILDLLHQTLSLLPQSSSALVIRPQDAASSAFASPTVGGVRTRQQRNPLIHNLLTDRPIISASLPPDRFVPPVSTAGTPTPHATFVKRGMPVTIIPDPRTHPWHPPGPDGTTLTLADPRIHFPRLLHLIEDSFGRKLDAKHYLARVSNRLAGIIIAGEYEGGAILTWEQPPPSSSSAAAAPRPWIPYLDKFAVLQRSQGAGGVADIVFNAMVRDAFPHGVVWRSRKNNPVNRWYFERADGTWKIPGTQWAMFWTGDELWGGGGAAAAAADGASGVEAGLRTEEWRRRRWVDYVAVCKGIEASWADAKAPPD